jgi:shikimate kinase
MIEKTSQDQDVALLPGRPVKPSSRQDAGNLYLIGYRGTGKSTVARLLAERLAWPWVDLDELLEKREARSVRMIFEQEGEGGFRLIEASLLLELSRLQCHVIATGGGIVLGSPNRDVLRKTGKCAWLTADPATVWERIRTDPTTSDRRPNLTHGGVAEIEELLHRREPFYRECADCTVDTANRSPEEAASLILAHLNLG